MTSEEQRLFVNLLFNHRHLWMTFQEYRYLQEHPDVDWETAHEIFFEETEDIYKSLADALLEAQPLQDKLETILLQSRLTQAEVEDWLKKNHR
jgi:hypothetical protein